MAVPNQHLYLYQSSPLPSPQIKEEQEERATYPTRRRKHGRGRAHDARLRASTPHAGTRGSAREAWRRLGAGDAAAQEVELGGVARDAGAGLAVEKAGLGEGLVGQEEGMGSFGILRVVRC